MASGNYPKNDQAVTAAEQTSIKKSSKTSHSKNKPVTDSKDAYSQVLEAVSKSQAVIEFNMDGTVITANDNFLQIVGYSLKEVKGKHHRIFCTEAHANSQEYKKFWENVKKGHYDSKQYQRIGKDGKEIWLQASYNPIMNEEGKPFKIVKFATEITEQKKLEATIQQASEALKMQETELRSKVEEEMRHKEIELNGQMGALNNAAIVSEVDLKGNILAVNDEFCRLAKYTKEELIGQKQSIVRHPDMPAAIFDDLWATIVKGKVWRGEVKNRAKDGSHYWVAATITPVLGENGRPVKYIGVRFDITAQKDQEEKIKKMLFDAQQTAEEMKAQEEEIRQNMEEMQATQEETERRQVEMEGQLAAIDSTSAYIEFNMDGIVQTANDLFLRAMKYSLDEIKGKHHRLFIDSGEVNSPAYTTFWNDLRAGRPQMGEFKRIARDGSHIWLLASYTPVLDKSGTHVKVIKLATDVTAQKLRNANFEGQLNAVSRAQGIIEFNLDGTVISANDNFLNALGYRLDEIQNKHHQLFCEPQYANSQEYKAFWEKLNRGEFVTGTFKRIGKNGKEVFIQATYNPIFGLDGKPVKVVKYAVDVTEFTLALKAVRQFISELKGGNFDASINIKAEGDLGQMILDNLALRDTLKEIITQVNHVAKAAGEEGKLNARLNLKDTHGEWKVLIDSMNMLLASVSEPVLEFNAIISEMAKGDLTNRFEMKVSGDILNMANALNTAIRNLNDLLSTIGVNSEIVADSSNNMLRKSEGMKNNTTEVASAIAQMAKGAQEQAAKTDASSKLVEEVLKSANIMEQKSNIINKAAEKGQKGCDNGMKIVKRLVENMGEIGESARKTSGSIDILTQRAEEIARTLNVITDIAAQTNLLALNAAIEAARAGDAGRGFAVVAEEIRKLAEDSRRSAVDIEKIIKDVQKDTLAAGKAIETMQASVKQGDHASKEAEEIFQEISKSSNETFSYSKEIQDATIEQKTSIASVVKNIEQIVVVAEETAAGTQQVASSSQQLNQGMNEITDSSLKLSKVAADLQTGISKFKLKK